MTTSEALRRVFLPSLNIAKTYPTNPIVKSANTRPQCLSRPSPTPQQFRNASIGGRMIQLQSYAGTRPGGRTFGPKDGPGHPPRDEEIKAFKIHLVYPGDKGLPEPRILSDVLDARLRDEKGRPTQFLQEVRPPSEEDPYPVCRMYDKKAVREAEDARRKAAKAKSHFKQLELSWTISDNDLGHRMARLKEYLEKGWRAEIVFGSKRKGWGERREASAEEANGVLEKIRKVVGGVEGAQEKQMQGEVGKEAVLFFEGKVKK